MKVFFLMTMTLVFMSCSTTSYQDEVIQTMENREHPEWATLSQTYFTKDGKIFFVGYTEGASSNRISAMLRISDNNARLEFAREITNQMNFIFQNIEEGIGEGGQLTRFYGTEVSKFLAHGIRQEKRFWEKVKYRDEDGDLVIKTRIYSLVSMRESELKKAIRESINANNEITKAVKDKIDAHMVSEIDKMMN